MASAVLALYLGEECCFRIFVRYFLRYSPDPPSPLLRYSCNPRFHRREHLEGICDIFWVLTRGSVGIIFGVFPHMKPERRYPPAAGLQYSSVVPQVVSRLGSRNLE